jgi:hypothetical protein
MLSAIALTTRKPSTIVSPAMAHTRAICLRVTAASFRSNPHGSGIGQDYLDSEEPSLRRTRVPPVNFEQMEATLRHRLQALPPAARAELLHVLRLPDLDRVGRSASSGDIRRAAPSPSACSIW